MYILSAGPLTWIDPAAELVVQALAITDRGAETSSTGAALNPPRSSRRRAAKADCRASVASTSGKERGSFGA